MAGIFSYPAILPNCIHIRVYSYDIATNVNVYFAVCVEKSFSIMLHFMIYMYYMYT